MRSIYFIALLGMIAALLYFTSTADGAMPSELPVEAAASDIAGKPVAVLCELPAQFREFKNVVAIAYLGTEVAFLRQRICRTLNKVALGAPVKLYNEAFAFMTLAHEVAHLRGIKRERVAECWALDHVKRLAHLTGSSRKFDVLREAHRQNRAGVVTFPCKRGKR